MVYPQHKPNFQRTKSHVSYDTRQYAVLFIHSAGRNTRHQPTPQHARRGQNICESAAHASRLVLHVENINEHCNEVTNLTILIYVSGTWYF